MTRFIMSISDAASMILKIGHIAKDSETFILKMTAVKIEDLAKTMIQVYKEKNKLAKSPQIKISKVRGYERFHEFLVTSDEISFCHDVGYMYKITKEQTKHTISLNDVNSSTAERISINKLRQVINELFDEVVY